MTQKHTPGPWRTLGEWAVVTKTRTIVDLYKTTADCEELDEIAANARLIAAAPELLWFAEQVVMGITSGLIKIETPAEETLEKVIKSTYAAIAKARGQA